MYFTYNNEEYKFKFTHQSNPEKGVSPYGSHNIFGSSPNILLSR